MAHDIVRVEKAKSREGLDEVFVHVNYVDDDSGEIMTYARWMTPTEVEQYLADESKATLDSVVGKYAATAKQHHEANKAAVAASHITVEKVIAALVNANLMEAPKTKLSQAEVDNLTASVRTISAEKVSAVVLK